MQVQQVKNETVSFGLLKRESLLSQKIFDGLLETPAVKKFGEKFDATLSVDSFISSKDNKRIQYELNVSDIKSKPKNVFDKLFSRFQPSKTEIVLKTHATTEEDLVERISKMRSNTLFDIYNK